MTHASAMHESEHPDNIAIDRFAQTMKEKMALCRARGRTGWDDKATCTIESLCALLLDSVAKGDPVDVGNFTMMVWARGEEIVAEVAQAADSAGRIAELKERARRWKACHDHMVLRNEYLAQRPDLPVDRIPAFDQMTVVIADLREEVAEEAAIRDKLAHLLAGVAIALKGPEPDLTRWSYHDLPDIAGKLMLELELFRTLHGPKASK